MVRTRKHVSPGKSGGSKLPKDVPGPLCGSKFSKKIARQVCKEGKSFVEYAVEETKRLVQQTNFVGSKYPKSHNQKGVPPADSWRQGPGRQREVDIWFYDTGGAEPLAVTPSEETRPFGPWVWPGSTDHNPWYMPWHLAGVSRTYSETNCYYFIRDVLVYAYEMIGKPKTADHINSLITRDEGTGNSAASSLELAKYLMKEWGWRAYYWNPDVSRPDSPLIAEKAPGKDWALDRSYESIRKANEYYKIKISGYVINYKLDGRDLPTKQDIAKLSPKEVAALQQQQAREVATFQRLEALPFALGIVEPGRHNFFLSDGTMYQVHQSEVGAGVYSTPRFIDCKRYHGLILVPREVPFSA